VRATSTSVEEITPNMPRGSFPQRWTQTPSMPRATLWIVPGWGIGPAAGRCAVQHKTTELVSRGVLLALSEGGSSNSLAFCCPRHRATKPLHCSSTRSFMRKEGT